MTANKIVIPKMVRNVIIIALILLAVAIPLRAQTPESTWSYIYNNTLIVPDDVCYDKDLVPRIQVAYAEYMGVTYVNLEGDTIALKYANDGATRWILAKVVIKARPDKKTICY